MGIVAWLKTLARGLFPVIIVAMTNATINRRIMNLEAELILLKKAVAKDSIIDFDIDERNWAKIRLLSKKIRAKLYKERYG